MVRVEVFTAGTNLAESRDFIVGHRKVLQVFDIANITSASVDWAFSDASYIITIKDLDGKLIGGARLQVADGKLALPIESAVGEMDDDIYRYISDFKQNGIAEACGLWNSREAAKAGIGSRFLTRATVAVAAQLNIKRMVMLCAPSIVSVAEEMGARIIKSLGNEGKFYYPKLDLVATAMIIDDIYNIEGLAKEDQRLVIEDLRKNPQQKVQVETRRGDVEIEYDLIIR